MAKETNRLKTSDNMINSSNNNDKWKYVRMASINGKEPQKRNIEDI